MSTNMMIISNSDYGVICLIAGLGWGLFLATIAAAILIDDIKWKKSVR